MDIGLRDQFEMPIFEGTRFRFRPVNIMDINELYDLAIRGDQTAEQQLFGYLSVSFRSFIRHRGMDANDADDIVQTALLKIAETYRRADIHTSFAGWAHAVLRNHLVEHFRSRDLDRRKTVELEQRQSTTNTTDPNPMLTTELSHCLKSIHERNPIYAQVLTLRFQGYTTAEICERLTISAGNLYVILSRARTTLRACLKKKGVLGV